MQSSKRLHFDEKVSMRRLKPLYDLVDAGQNRKAISEADKMLKKHPKLHTANALKALALIRIERLTDAEALLATLEDICKHDEIDEAFVQALSHCYKELNRPDRIVDMYTELTRRQSTYEPFMRELFFAYARCANLREQQRVALQLAKICTTTEPSTYYIWAVLVILVQGFENKQLGVSMFFPLANRMLEKVKDEELLQHQGGLELRLMALEAVGKYGEAIELISVRSDHQLSTMGMRVLHQLRRLHQLSGNHTQLFRLCMDSVDNDPNDWSNWTLLLDSFLLLQDSDGSFLSSIIKKCHVLSEECDDRHDLFGRHSLLLVKLLFFERLSGPKLNTQRALVEEQFGSPFMLHQELVRIFHDRPSTFMDVKNFLHLLTADEQRALLRYISTISVQFLYRNNPTHDDDVHHHHHHCDGGAACASSSSSSSLPQPVPVASVWTFLLAEMISCHCFWPSTLPDEALKASPRRLLSEIPQIYGNDLAVAVLAQMVSNYCWEFFLRTGDYNLLISLLSFLEVLNKQSQCNNAPIPILLCRIYALFGTTWRINELVKQLDIKFVQRINFAFLQCFVAENFGQLKRAANYYASMVNLHKSNAREISEGIVAAFRREKYMQITNLYDFLQACQNAVYSQCCAVQHRILSACFGAHSLEMATECLRMDDDFDLESLVDNREFNALKIFLSDTTLREMREGTLNEIKAFLRLRTTLGSAISAIGKQTLEREAASFLATLEECRKAFGGTAPKIRNLLENFTDTGLELLLLCCSSTAGQQQQNGIIQLPVLVLNAATTMGTTTMTNADDKQRDKQKQQQQKLLDEAAESFATLLADHVGHFAKLSSPTTQMPLKERVTAVRSVSKLLEMLSFALIGAKRLERLFVPLSSSKNINGGDGKQEKRNDQRNSNKKQRSRLNLDTLGPFSRPIHQALQSLRTFGTAMLNQQQQQSADVPSLSSVEEGAEGEKNQFGLRNMLPDNLAAEFAIAERTVRANVVTSMAHSFEEIVETIDHLIRFSRL